MLSWQRWPAAIFTLFAVAVVLLDRYEPFELLRVPTLPLAVVGGALGIFVSFRTNSGYDRWWEGRKLWGALINASRHFTNQVVTYLDSAPEPERQALVRRHIAYVHVLRCLLRSQKPFDDDIVIQYLTEHERQSLTSETNLTNALLEVQLRQLTRLTAQGHLDAFRLQSLDQSLRAFLDIQGGCERIKNTPFPPGYGFLADRLTLAFGILLPLGLVADLGWVAVPVNLLVCLAFRMIGEVGRVLETPFTMFWPALPLSALARTIEVNLLERLGETELPPMLKPTERGVLM